MVKKKQVIPLTVDQETAKVIKEFTDDFDRTPPSLISTPTYLFEIV